MDFSISDEQRKLCDEARRFATNELVVNTDNSGLPAPYSVQTWKKCADLGILGLPFPERFGGSDMSILTTLLVMEALGEGARDYGLLFSLSAQMWSVQMPIWEFGTEEQQQRYLAKLNRGEIIGAHGMSEPNSGSDAFSLRTSAIREGDSYVLNGSKTFVTNAPTADVFLVFANIDPPSKFMGITAFLVDADTPGLAVGKPFKKMGLVGSPMSEVSFHNCRIPGSALLGKERGGMKLFNSSMEWERACILACNLGGMSRQITECVSYANERVQFGQPISANQAVSHKIVDMRVRLEASRLLLYNVAVKKDAGEDAQMESAIAKLFLSEAWVKSSMEAIQIHGGYGYMSEFPFEQDLRDAVGGKLYSGTSEIQKNLIARQLGI